MRSSPTGGRVLVPPTSQSHTILNDFRRLLDSRLLHALRAPCTPHTHYTIIRLPEAPTRIILLYYCSLYNSIRVRQLQLGTRDAARHRACSPQLPGLIYAFVYYNYCYRSSARLWRCCSALATRCTCARVLLLHVRNGSSARAFRLVLFFSLASEITFLTSCRHFNNIIHS